MEPEKFRCGQCMKEFATIDLVHSHICPVMSELHGKDVTLKDPEAMGENWAEISAEALKRGQEA